MSEIPRRVAAPSEWRRPVAESERERMAADAAFGFEIKFLSSVKFDTCRICSFVGFGAIGTDPLDCIALVISNLDLVYMTLPSSSSTSRTSVLEIWKTCEGVKWMPAFGGVDTADAAFDGGRP